MAGVTSPRFATGFSPVFGESAASILNGEVTPLPSMTVLFRYAVNTENPIIATVTSFTGRKATAVSSAWQQDHIAQDRKRTRFLSILRDLLFSC